MLDRYTRTILFVKPELVIVFDRLAAREASTFQYWLHAANEFQVDGQRSIEARAGDVACAIDFLAPEGLKFTQTDQYDPNPEPQITTARVASDRRDARPAPERRIRDPLSSASQPPGRPAAGATEAGARRIRVDGRNLGRAGAGPVAQR